MTSIVPCLFEWIVVTFSFWSSYILMRKYGYDSVVEKVVFIMIKKVKQQPQWNDPKKQWGAHPPNLHMAPCFITWG